MLRLSSEILKKKKKKSTIRIATNKMLWSHFELIGCQCDLAFTCAPCTHAQFEGFVWMRMDDTERERETVRERESRDRTQFLLIIGSVCHWDGKTYLFLLCANMFVFCFVTCSLDESTELIRLMTYLFFGRLVCCLIVKICKLCEMKHATCITPLPKWCKRIGKKSQF